MNRLSKGAVEAEIANAVVRFHREQLGRGPKEARAHILGDMVIVRSSSIFTVTEARLAVTEEGRRLVRSARMELRSINRAEIEALIAEIAGTEVSRSYYDVDIEAEEQVEIFVLKVNLESLLKAR